MHSSDARNMEDDKNLVATESAVGLSTGTGDAYQKAAGDAERAS